MVKNQCKAKTRSDEMCKLPAGQSGYCHIHDPLEVEKRKSSRDELKK